MLPETLWKIIGRYDAYIISTNQKATATIAYNVLVVGSIIIKESDVLGFFDGHPHAQHFAAVLLAIITLISLISVGLTFFVVMPYLWSPPPGTSLIFYGDVRRFANDSEYAEKAKTITDSDLHADLAGQVYAVAKAAYKKFFWMRVAVMLILLVQIPALTLMFLTKLLILL